MVVVPIIESAVIGSDVRSSSLQLPQPFFIYHESIDWTVCFDSVLNDATPGNRKLDCQASSWPYDFSGHGYAFSLGGGGSPTISPRSGLFFTPQASSASSKNDRTVR